MECFLPGKFYGTRPGYGQEDCEFESASTLLPPITLPWNKNWGGKGYDDQRIGYLLRQ